MAFTAHLWASAGADAYPPVGTCCLIFAVNPLPSVPLDLHRTVHSSAQRPAPCVESVGKSCVASETTALTETAHPAQLEPFFSDWWDRAFR